MKKTDVKVGKCYAAKVSGKMATVRIDAANPRGGWEATNLRTSKKVRIRSPQRLRHETRAPGQTKPDIAKTVETVQKGDPTKGVTVPTEKKTAGKRAPAKGDGKKRRSGLDAAAKVLAEAGKPLNCKTIVERMLAKGLWKTSGKTPGATIYAAIIRHIAANGPKARFRKVGPGKFTLAK